MVWPVVAAVAASAIGSMLSADAQKDAAKKAARAQQSAADQGIEFERERLAQEKEIYEENMAEYRRKQALLERQQEQTRTLLAPYMQSGQGALYEMMALTGMTAPQPVSMPTYTPGGAAGGSLIEQTRDLGRLPAYARKEVEAEFNKQLSDYVPQVGRIIPLQSGVAGGIAEQPLMDQAELERLLYARDQAIKNGSYQVPAGTIGGLSKDYKKKLDQAYEYAKYLDKQNQTVTSRQQAEDQRIQAIQTKSPYAGLTGEQAQTQAIDKIASSPLLKELTAQGEQAMLQQASATGGLRGGNIQGALAQFRPRMLQEELDRQYSRLASMSAIGQQSIMGAPTTNVPALPQYSGASQIPSLYGDIGASQAGLALAQGQTAGQLYSDIGRLGGYAAGTYLNQPRPPATTTTYRI